MKTLKAGALLHICVFTSIHVGYMPMLYLEWSCRRKSEVAVQELMHTD